MEVLPSAPVINRVQELPNGGYLLDSVTIRLGLFRQKLKLLCWEHRVLPVRGLFPGRWLGKH